MKKKFRICAGLTAALAFLCVLGFGDETCEKYGLVQVNGGEYIIQNNCWGSDAAQCVTTSGTGFTVTTSQHNQGSVASYPSIFKGCHWDTCTTGWTSIKVSSLSKATYSWSVSTAGVTGTYDVAAEAWFSPSLDCTKGYNNGAEMMIWMDAKGIVPAGSKVGNYGPFEVWKGSMSDGVNTWTYICYYRIAETSATIDLMGFIADSISRGFMTSSMYLHDIEAGFELMVNGQGLKLNSFTADIAGGGSGPQPGPTPDLDPIPSVDNPCCGLTSVEKVPPFTFDGSGKYCWTMSSTPEYINCNNLEVLAINGVDFTNTYIAAADFPAKIDGKYYIYYKGNWSWSHFDAAKAIATEPTPGGDTTVPPTTPPTPEPTILPETPAPTTETTLPPTNPPTPASTATGLPGDVNNDGTVTIVDALMVAQYYVGMTPSPFNVNNADVNCSGTVDIVDALRIAQYYVGLISSLSC
jgi:hypothetical protein